MEFDEGSQSLGGQVTSDQDLEICSLGWGQVRCYCQQLQSQPPASSHMSVLLSSCMVVQNSAYYFLLLTELDSSSLL